MRQADFFTAAGKEKGGASAPPLSPEQRRRFKIACRMLRQAGRLDLTLPQQKKEKALLIGFAAWGWRQAQQLRRRCLSSPQAYRIF